MTSIHTGGCQCGAVRYRIDAELRDPHLCHCRMCQKAAGNFFMPLASMPASALTMTRGEPAWFRSSDPVRRGFCRDYGTPLFLIDDIEPDRTFITLGSLDDPSSVRPVSIYGTEARMPWIAEVAAMDGEETEVDLAERGDHLARIRATNHQHPDHDTEVWPQNEPTS